MPPYTQTPTALTVDCAVPVVPSGADLAKLVEILSDSFASLEGCNYRMGKIRRIEAERVSYYHKLSESPSK
ncbi:hypothetical protein AAM37_gp84 [Pantoea phage vB_PagM_AAM37]|uniref:Uncharacterized protein n=1 Tax=Pantoea phage vB_PagM_AAM37 TaxID=2588093 RepID=A0A513ZYJ0_9CAUD|nr:hypothetical protein HWC22_gp84 [Pantoea phage vB_PagM_AAM37]QDH45754.1 hypothetical protein AAM37_gp84 [Pantoea phage vB_PagM_AAM37]